MSRSLYQLRQQLRPKTLIGGATWILLIGLLGSGIYNAIWDDDNKWNNLKFGHPSDVHNIAVPMIVISLIGFVAILAAFVITIACPTLKQVQLMGWIVGYSLGVIIIILQGYALSITTYGGSLIQDEYNYLEQYTSFDEYVSTYSPNATYHLVNFSFTIINQTKDNSVPASLNPDWFDLPEPEAFLITYKKKNPTVSQYDDEKVASCAFDWFNLTLTKKISGDPCSFSLENEDAFCVGGWTGKSFKDYWCHLWTEKEDERNFLNEKPSVADKQKRQQAKLRDLEVIDSLDAFYWHNAYLVGINVTGVVLSVLFVILDRFASQPGQKRSRSNRTGAHRTSDTGRKSRTAVGK